MLTLALNKRYAHYRRAFVPGGTWFFTVNLLERHTNDLLIREITLLREKVQQVKANRPFRIDAWVVLADHIYAVWTLLAADADFSTVKSAF